jgi:hypothetical protein
MHSARLGDGLPLPPQGGENVPLINLVIALAIVGVALYLINRYIPMASSIKSILNVVVVVCSCSMGLAGGGTVGRYQQLPGRAITHS